MGTQKHRNLTVDTLNVKDLYIGGEPFTPGGDVINVTVEEVYEQAPVAPHPAPLPEKTTMAALRDRVEFLTSVLLEAGLIHPVPREEAEGVEAPVTAPQDDPAPTTPEATPQAVAAGVVDGE